MDVRGISFQALSVRILFRGINFTFSCCAEDTENASGIDGYLKIAKSKKKSRKRKYQKK